MLSNVFLTNIFSNPQKKEDKLVSKIEQDLYKKRIIDEYDLIIISLYKPIRSMHSLDNQLSLYQSESKDFNNYLKFTFRDSKHENLLANEIKKFQRLITNNLY